MQEDYCKLSEVDWPCRIDDRMRGRSFSGVSYGWMKKILVCFVSKSYGMYLLGRYIANNDAPHGVSIPIMPRSRQKRDNCRILGRSDILIFTHGLIH